MRNSLLKWYQQNYRKLPWRDTKDPYKIWISEIMLQQTRVAAVIPLFHNFLKHFPDLKTLSTASEAQVLEQWAGLGYYSRARNIHKASKILAKTGFPESYEQIIALPGFGPYTARAVSSFAFNEKVGVLDGNVIRLLSRVFSLPVEWWRPKERQKLQDLADQLANTKNVYFINQALIELGATHCTPKKPSCITCPWVNECKAFKNKNIDQLPLKKSKRDTEFWQWDLYHIENETKVALIKNQYAPFLKGHFIHPGHAKQLKVKPKKFDFKHSVTHHEIFVNVHRISFQKLKNSTRSWSSLYGLSDLSELTWTNKKNLKQTAQSSYLKKLFQQE